MKTMTRRAALLSSATIGSILCTGAAPALADDTGQKITSLAPEEATCPINQGLTAEDFDRRQLEIDEAAQPGAPLSEEDAEFIRIQVYRRQHEVVAYAATKTRKINRSASGAGGTGTVKGSHQFTYSDNPFNSKGAWSAHWTASGSSAVKKITASEHIRVYEIVGKSGVGVVYRADPTSTVNGRTNAFNRSESFRAYGGYISAHYKALFYTKSGSFEIYG